MSNFYNFTSSVEIKIEETYSYVMHNITRENIPELFHKDLQNAESQRV